MQSINHALFLALNAPDSPSTGTLFIATMLAQTMIAFVPLLLVAGWLRGPKLIRIGMLQAACAGIVGLLIAQLIGMVWPMPRPFMIGLGHQFLAHASDASFPSDHLTLWWSVACSLVLHRRTRFVGGCLALIGLGMAWSRVYLGVHFPLDMAGALVVAILSAGLCQRARLWLASGPYALLMTLYRTLFGAVIRRGWLPQ